MNKKIILRTAVIVGLILIIPIIGNFTVEGWNWGVFDFVIVGLLLFLTGLAIEFVLAKVTSPVYRVLAVVGIVLALFAVWVELAVEAVSRSIELI